MNQSKLSNMPILFNNSCFHLRVTGSSSEIYIIIIIIIINYYVWMKSFSQCHKMSRSVSILRVYLDIYCSLTNRFGDYHVHWHCQPNTFPSHINTHSWPNINIKYLKKMWKMSSFTSYQQINHISITFQHHLQPMS